MKKRFLLFAALILLFKPVYSQVVFSQLSFPTQNDSIVVFFDATKGNAGLKGFTGDVYAHTGVITNLSTGPTDWKHVKTNWGQNTPDTKLTRISTDLYQLVIGFPRVYYSVTSSSEKILKLAFVFRSSDNQKTGREADGSDIFLDLFDSGLNVSIISPSESPLFVALNDSVKVEANQTGGINLSLFLNDSLIAQTDSTSLVKYVTASFAGKYRIKAVAKAADNSTKEDSASFIVNADLTIENLPSGIKDGINYVSDTSVVLSLFAPEKQFVYVIGDFTNWEVEPEYFMKRTPDNNRYWLEVSGLTPGKEYIFQYLVDGSIKIADPYSEKISDPYNDKWITGSTYPGLIPYPVGKTTEIASVLQTAQQPYQWQVSNFQKPNKTDLVIYELLIRDFLASHDYKTLIDTLGYLKNLGINAIELMPVAEFEGNESWGYNPDFHLAPDKYYGPKNDLKKFIDAAHANGIAVIMDIVLNHVMGQSPLARLYWDSANNRPAANNPWLNQIPKHDFNVGNDFNHESTATKAYVDRVTSFWISEYHFDGFRFDLSKGFTQKNTLGNINAWGQFDQSRINILERIATNIWQIDSTAYIILEHFADNTEEKILSDFGMMIWGKSTNEYNEATMGYNTSGKSDFSWGAYTVRGWSQPNLVTYMESHDEERLMYKNLQFGNSSGSYSVKNLSTALQRIKMAAAFFFTIPGPKMIWQFGELGYDISIDFNGRTGNKPIKWNYFSQPDRLKLYKTFKTLINLKKDYSPFKSNNFSLNVSGAGKRINLVDSSFNVSIIGNFDVNTLSVNPNFADFGWWYDYFTGDSMFVTNLQLPITLLPGEFHIFTSKRLPTPEPDIVTGIERNENISVIKNFELMQNYPNPFNPSTKITFLLPQASFVSLKVYDLLGREVKTLVNGKLNSGSYTFDFNASDLASGIYFYRISAQNEKNNFTRVRKMMLLK